MKIQLWNGLYPFAAGDKDECMVTKEHIHEADCLQRELFWDFFSLGTITPNGPWPPHSRGLFF